MAFGKYFSSYQLENIQKLTFISAFMCHHNTFLIYGSIADPNQKKWEIVTHASIITSLVVAVLFGIAGYTTFKAYSQGEFVKK